MFGRKNSPPPQPRNPELDQLSFDALLEKKVEIDEAIKQRGEMELDGVLARVNALASSLGTSAGALFGLREMPQERAAPKKKRETPPKYRNPSNPDETWSGKGHAPAWLKELLAAGREKEEFAIQRTEAAE